MIYLLEMLTLCVVRISYMGNFIFFADLVSTCTLVVYLYDYKSSGGMRESTTPRNIGIDTDI